MTKLEPTPVADSPHPVVWFARRAHEVLDEVLSGGVRLSSLPAPATAEAIGSLDRLAARVEALKGSLLPHADIVEVAAEAEATPVATSTATWFAHTTRTPVGPARRRVHTAKQLDAVYLRTQDAALTGAVHPDQVEVIVTTLDHLPNWVTAEQRVQAEEHLIGLAAEHDARRLKVLARHLAHVLDPDAADADLARRLEAEEADAARKTMFTIRDDGNGTCHGRFRIPALHGAMLSVALDALASPKRPDPISREERVEPAEQSDRDATGDAADPGEVVAAMRTRTAPEVLGEAFCQLLERFPTKKLPKTGGGLATVLVTIPLDLLETGLGIATLSTGGQLSTGQARRLACTAGIIPAVLGSESQPLDLGRKVRLHTEPQRIAMTLRDKHCTAEGCHVPAAWCHAHHTKPWAEGGNTSVTDGRLVCGPHHRMIHHPRYTATYLDNGKIRITRIRQ